MDINHRSLFYLKYDVSETGFCLLHVERNQLSPIDRAIPSLLTPTTRAVWIMIPTQPTPPERDCVLLAL
jgi:hypothetical protein